MNEKKGGFSDPAVRAKAAEARLRNKEKNEEVISDNDFSEKPDDTSQVEVGIDHDTKKDFFWVENKNPNKTYYHAERNLREVERLKKEGWVVTDRNVEKALHEGTPIDSTTGIPEAVLMEIDKEKYNKRHEGRINKAKDRFEKSQYENIENMKRALHDAGIGGSIKEMLGNVLKQRELLRK